MISSVRQHRVRVLEALELRAKQFRSRDGIWPFRVPHEPLDLDEIIDRLMTAQPVDFLQLQRLKKRKLLLKDAIQKIESGLLPDIIA